MSEFRIVMQYPHPPSQVWRVLTDPTLVPLWTSTGQGGRPEGFAPVVGTEFKFIAKPTPGWAGVVYCKVLDVEEPRLLKYSWAGEEGEEPTIVTCKLEPNGSGTQLTWEHTDFRGVGGFVMSKLLHSVRKKMLSVGFPAVLNAVDESGNLRERGTLGARGQ